LEIEKTKVNADIQLEKEKFELEKEKFESNRKSERQKLDEDFVKLALGDSTEWPPGFVLLRLRAQEQVSSGLNKSARPS
jgi:hypothetical protein